MLLTNYLKKTVLASLLLSALQLFAYSAEAATVQVEVNWENWSSENRVQILDSAGNLLTTKYGGTNYICNPATCFDSTTNNSYGPITFTFNDVPTGTYTLRLEDDFGDGWNGAGSYVRVRVNGTTNIDRTLSGSIANENFTITDTSASVTTQTCSTSSLTGAWNTTTISSNSGAIPVDINLTTADGAVWDSALIDTMNTINAWSDPAVQGATSLSMVFNWDTVATDGEAAVYQATSSDGVNNVADPGGTGSMVLSFNGRTVSNAIVHFDRIGGNSGSLQSNSMRVSPTTSGVTLGRLAGTNHFETYNNGSFYRTILESLNSGVSAESTLNSQDGTAAGSVVYTGKYSTLTLNTDGVGIEAAGSDGFELVICVPQADLQLTKVVDNPTPVSGTNVTFTLVVTNNGGPDAANNIEVTDLLPAGLTYVSATAAQGSYNSGTGVWSVGSLNSGASTTLQIVATATGTSAIVNRAEITNSDRVDPDSDFDTSFATDDIGDAVADDDEASVTVTPTAAIVSCPTGSTATGSGFATSGSGLYREDIFWLDWNCGAITSFSPGEIINKSWNAPNGVVISATITNLTNAIQPYVTGTYFGDQLDDLYGGVNPIGLRNAIDSQDPRYDISFSVTVNGQSVDPDIIIADAESSDTANESFNITTSGQAWELIDRFAGSSLDVTFSNSNQTIFWNDDPDGGFGSLVALSENAGSIDVEMNAGGAQALAFGVMIHFDYGDAPDSYSDVVHYSFKTASGGGKPVVATDVNSIALATFNTDPTFLGAVGPDSDPSQQNSGNALGDDSDAEGDDEDGVSSFAAVNASSTSYSVTVSCNGTGTITGWIDWAIDGGFDDGTIDEAASTTCSGGTATLNWTGLTGLADGTTFVRIRASNNSSSITTPTSVGISGEVEDYSLLISPSADIEVTKVSTSTNYTPGGTDTYTITITNNGPSAVNGVQIADTLPAGATFSASWSCSATAGSSCSSSSGGAVGGNQVTGLTANIINGGVITLTIPVQYSTDPSVY